MLTCTCGRSLGVIHQLGDGTECAYCEHCSLAVFEATEELEEPGPDPIGCRLTDDGELVAVRGEGE